MREGWWQAVLRVQPHGHWDTEWDTSSDSPGPAVWAALGQQFEQPWDSSLAGAGPGVWPVLRRGSDPRRVPCTRCASRGAQLHVPFLTAHGFAAWMFYFIFLI